MLLNSRRSSPRTRRAAHVRALALLAAGTIAIAGGASTACVSTGRLYQVEEERDALAARNSALETESGAVGLSYVSKEFHVGASYNGFNSTYGVPGHAHEQEETETAAGGDEAAGVRIRLKQRRTDLQAFYDRDGIDSSRSNVRVRAIGMGIRHNF